MAEHSASYLKSSALDRIFGRTFAALVRIGLVRGPFYVLEVRGRTISLPVDLLQLGEQSYLVCARGDSNWVRNARAAGEVVLVRAMRRRRYAVRELALGLRPPVLKAYLDRFANQVQRFFSVPKGSQSKRSTKSRRVIRFLSCSGWTKQPEPLIETGNVAIESPLPLGEAARVAGG